MNKEVEKLIEWEALQEFPAKSWTEYHRNNWIAGAKRGYELAQEGTNDGWIKIEERMPEVNQRCIVYSQLEDVVYIDSPSQGDIERGRWDRVSHWRELPKPPKKSN